LAKFWAQRNPPSFSEQAQDFFNSASCSTFCKWFYDVDWMSFVLARALGGASLRAMLPVGITFTGSKRT